MSRQLSPEELERRRQLHAVRKAYRNREYTPDPDGIECCTCKRKLPRGLFSASIVRGRSYTHKRCIKCRATIYLRSKTCREKRALIASLKDKPCSICSHKFAPPSMLLVHRRGVKKFCVGMAWSGRSRSSIIEEAKKCDVVCSNCERINRLDTRQRGCHRHSKLADLAPELGKQVDLLSRLQELQELRSSQLQGDQHQVLAV